MVLKYYRVKFIRNNSKQEKHLWRRKKCKENDYYCLCCSNKATNCQSSRLPLSVALSVFTLIQMQKNKRTSSSASFDSHVIDSAQETDIIKNILSVGKPAVWWDITGREELTSTDWKLNLYVSQFFSKHHRGWQMIERWHPLSFPPLTYSRCPFSRIYG